MSDSMPIPAEPKFGSLAEKIANFDDDFQNFMFLVYYTNPLRDSVRIVLDDGSIKVWLRREKFEKLISEILNNTLDRQYQWTLAQIKMSLNSYGKMYYFNRIHNIFKEINEDVDIEHITPNDLITESRKTLVKEVIKDNYNEVKKQNEEYMNNIPFSTPTTNKFHQVVNNIMRIMKPTKKKKSLF